MSAAASRDAPMDELRALMAAHTPPLHALLVPSEDAHQSEYVSERDKRRQFISGFNGSAGLALITMKEALLWTDGRYFLQATQQLSDRWKLMRMGEDPPVEVWIADNLSEEAVIGINPWCISVNTSQRYGHSFSKKNQTLFELSSDLVDEIWKDRPLAKALPVTVHPVEFAGRSVTEKLKELRENLLHEKARGIIIAALDEVAWLYNIRGDDVHYSPVVHSYAIVTLHSAFFYVDKRKVSAEVQNYMTENGIDIREYNMVQSDVSLLASGQLKGSAVNGSSHGENNMNENSKVWIDSNSCCLALYSKLGEDQVLMLQSPIALPKAVKPHGGRRRRCGRRSHPPEGCGMLTVLEDFSRNVYKDGHGNETEEVEECGYVEDGPAEIIWQGNEITVKKNKAKVPKKAKDKQPIQQDKAHCPFYLKTADCRFGARCSSVHFYPDKSCTLLMKNMYSGPGFASEQDEGLEICKRPLSWKVGINWYPETIVCFDTTF